MKRKKLFFLLVIAWLLNGVALSLNAQSQPCLFDDLPAHNTRGSELSINAGIQAYLSNNRSLAATNKVIPVVVHIIHNGGTENISAARVQNQIDILNEDYGKLLGSNGDGSGVDTDIRFCLAKFDPNGNCTNGIVRIKSTLTNHNTSDRALLKTLSFWDPSRYLNIYVVKTIAGNVGGYASFPTGPPDEDGIVIQVSRFGSMGTPSTVLGRTTTHEVGHWLGLYHTFNGGCGIDVCLDGDYVCDTPPSEEPNFGCPTVNTCSIDFPDVNNQVENYMDYSDDACQNMFTQGQKLRMQGSLTSIRTVIWSDSNLVFTGCDSAYLPPATCPVIADFVTLTPIICVGNNVQFLDRSLNGPTFWSWYFDGADSAFSNLPNPIVRYSTVGTFSVYLEVSDANGSNSKTLQGYITVIPPGVGDSLSYGQDFDTGIYPPLGLTIADYDGHITWQLDSSAAFSGQYSISINNLINTNYGTLDELILPHQNLASAHPDSNVYLKFQWAYAKSDPSFSDELSVLISTDCGASFTRIFYGTEGSLVTGPTQTTPFVPNANQWDSTTINLNSYRNESFVVIKFVNVTDGGNKLYLDNIYLGDGSEARELKPTGILNAMEGIAGFSVYPNPASGNAFIKLTNLNRPDPVTINIYNTTGALVWQNTIDADTLARPIGLPLNNLTNGLYFIHVLSASGMVGKRKLVVINE